MTRTISGLAMWTGLLAACLATVPARAGVLDSLLLASEIKTFRVKVASGGPVDEERLQNAIAEGGTAGLDLARAVFAYNREAIQTGGVPVRIEGGGRVHFALMNGLALRQEQLPAVLDLVEEEVRTPVYATALTDGQRIEDFRRVWGGLYVRLHGGFEPAFRKAAEELQQPALDAVDRALRIETFGTVSNRPNNPRKLAFELYRPYLRAATGEEQAAAVSVASATWDAAALEDLRMLAYESPNPFARKRAFPVVARFLRYGHAYPPPGRNAASRSWAEAHHEVFDPEGAIAWERGYKGWRRQLHLLAYGRPPSETEEPPTPFRGSAGVAGESEADPAP